MDRAPRPAITADVAPGGDAARADAAIRLRQVEHEQGRRRGGDRRHLSAAAGGGLTAAHFAVMSAALAEATTKARVPAPQDDVARVSWRSLPSVSPLCACGRFLAAEDGR